MDMENDSADDTNRHSDEISDEDDEEEYVPIDRGWAWITVVGAFCTLSLVIGVLKSFGVLLLELSRRYDAPASLLATSQSLCGYLHIGLGPFANALIIKFNHRKVVFLGGLIAGFGLILTAFVRSIGLFFVTYGLLTGFGFGLCVSPSLVFPGQYFKKKLAIGNGLTSSGAGAGAFVFPNLVRYLLDHYMIEGCLLLLGGIVFNVCACACLLRPVSFWFKSRRKGAEKEPLKSQNDRENFSDVWDYKKENICKVLTKEKPFFSSDNNFKQDNVFPYDMSVSLSVPCLRSKYEHKRERRDTEPDNNVHKSRRQDENSFEDSSLIYTSLESLPISPMKNVDTKSVDAAVRLNIDSKDKNKPKKKIIDCQLFRNPIFQILNMTLFCGTYAHHTVYNFVPPLANEKGFSDSEGALFVSIVGITDLIGRMLTGIISDSLGLRRRIVYQINILIFGTCIVVLIHMDTFAGFIITTGLLGLTTGGYIGIQIAVLAEKLGRENLSTSWGYAAFFSSFSILLSPTIAGVLKDYTKSWIPCLWVASGLAIFGSIALCLITLIEFRNKR